MNEVISPDPDAPELPPPLESNSQDTSDKPPVYQDISDKPNDSEVVESKQCCYQDAHSLNDNAETGIKGEVVYAYQISMSCTCIHDLHCLCMYE